MALELYYRSGSGGNLSSAQLDANFRRIAIAVDALQDIVGGGSIGTVSSVGLSMPTGFSVAGSPITSSGSFAVTTSLNGIIKGNGSGFSAVASLSLSGSDISGVTPINKGGTNNTTFTNNTILVYDGTKIASSLTTVAEIGYLQGVTSNLQTQLNGKEPSFNILPISKGGTGLGSTPTNGQLLIGNGTGYSLASLTAGTNITITPGAGTITISSSAAGGVTTLNTLSGALAIAATSIGSDFTVSTSGGNTINLNIPSASTSNRGLLTSVDWNTFNGKWSKPSFTTGSVLFWGASDIAQDNASFFWDNTSKSLSILGSSSPTIFTGASTGTHNAFINARSGSGVAQITAASNTGLTSHVVGNASRSGGIYYLPISDVQNIRIGSSVGASNTTIIVAGSEYHIFKAGMMGVNKLTPIATLDVHGSIAWRCIQLSAASSILTEDFGTYHYVGSVNTIWTLPPISDSIGMIFSLRNLTTNTSTVTLTADGSDEIYGLSSLSSTFVINPNEGWTVQNDGTYWVIK